MDPSPRGDVGAVLVVDDHPASLMALAALLEPIGCEVITADSGETALRHVMDRDDLAVIVLDVKMPGIDGRETARMIRARRRSAHVPIIFHTGEHRERDDVLLGYRTGAIDYILKPAEPDVLRAKIANFVDLYRLRRELSLQRDVETELRREKESIQRFLGSAAHELRTPLAALKARVQLSRRRVSPQVAQEVGLDGIEGQVSRMTALVDDLLDASALQAGEHLIELADVDLAAVTRDAVAHLRPLSERHTIDVEAPPSLPIRGDARRLGQVVTNLVSNAIRYWPQGGRIVVRCTEADDRVTLEVIDKGAGIAPEEHATIFQAFGRAHSSTFGGLGLGLRIVTGIVRQHGGTIFVDSTGVPGEGARFVVVLPGNGGAVARADGKATF